MVPRPSVTPDPAQSNPFSEKRLVGAVADVPHEFRNTGLRTAIVRLGERINGGTNGDSPRGSWEDLLTANTLATSIQQRTVLPLPNLPSKISDAVLKELIDGCLQGLFATRLLDINFAQNGQNGSASVFGLESIQDASFRNTQRAITHDVTTFNYKQLNAFRDDIALDGKAKGKALGFALAGTLVRPDGRTYPASTNYGISDVEKYSLKDGSLAKLIGKFKAIQIHELGNTTSLFAKGHQRGNDKSKIDTDAGYQLELCVLGEVKKLK